MAPAPPGFTMAIATQPSPEEADMETSKKHFLLLLSLSKETAAIGKTILARIHKEVDANASPLWIDSRGIGVFITTELHANHVWSKCLWDTLTLDQQQALKDLLIVQVGPDWAGPRGSKAVAWMNSRFPRY